MHQRLMKRNWDKFIKDNYVFKGICTAKTVDAYWGAGSGTDCIHYELNKDGTYTYYCINTNQAKRWLDRFIWYNVDDVVSLEVNPNVEVFDTNNNRFNSKKIQQYNFNDVKVRSKNCRETFYTCDNIETIDISSWNMVNNTDFYAMFASSAGTNEFVSALRTIKLPADCGSKVTQCHKMFGWHHGLETITGMTTVDFSNCTNFSEMFCEDFKLKNVDFKIDGWVTSKATDIHSMFLKCYDLDFSKIGDFTTWDVSNVTDASGLFANCGFVDLDLSGWDFSKCKNISMIFQDQLHVHKTINLSNCKWTEFPDNSENMFYNCSSLEKIIAKGASGILQTSLQTRLVLEIPDRVSSDSFTLVLDDGNYRYDKTDSQWVKIS